jgi:aspartate 1-decarboxylase
MTREMLRAKIHRITVTECDVAYEGSLTLDRDLMNACGMVPFERIDVYDVDNASRFSTYLIAGESGSRACCVNGAAARLVQVGHKLIIAAYASLDDEHVRGHVPKIVLVDDANRMTIVKDHEGAGVKIGTP